MTNEELRELLAQDMAAVMAEVMEAANGREMNLTQIEEVALKARHEFGRRVAQRLVEQQVDKNAHELPVRADGKNMSPKGKKRKMSSRASER